PSASVCTRPRHASAAARDLPRRIRAPRRLPPPPTAHGTGASLDMLPATLDDLKVLDLSEGHACPICAKMLADFGADVVKLEPPAGDAGRRIAPFFGADPHPEKSLVFLLANLNKRGARLDLEDPEGRELLLRLAKSADIVVESYKPGYLARLGLDYA